MRLANAVEQSHPLAVDFVVVAPIDITVIGWLGVKNQSSIYWSILPISPNGVSVRFGRIRIRKFEKGNKWKIIERNSSYWTVFLMWPCTVDRKLVWLLNTHLYGTLTETICPSYQKSTTVLVLLPQRLPGPYPFERDLIFITINCRHSSSKHRPNLPLKSHEICVACTILTEQI